MCAIFGVMRLQISHLVFATIIAIACLEDAAVLARRSGKEFISWEIKVPCKKRLSVSDTGDILQNML